MEDQDRKTSLVAFQKCLQGRGLGWEGGVRGAGPLRWRKQPAAPLKSFELPPLHDCKPRPGAAGGHAIIFLRLRSVTCCGRSCPWAVQTDRPRCCPARSAPGASRSRRAPSITGSQRHLEMTGPRSVCPINVLLPPVSIPAGRPRLPPDRRPGVSPRCAGGRAALGSEPPRRAAIKSAFL